MDDLSKSGLVQADTIAEIEYDLSVPLYLPTDDRLAVDMLAAEFDVVLTLAVGYEGDWSVADARVVISGYQGSRHIEKRRARAPLWLGEWIELATERSRREIDAHVRDQMPDLLAAHRDAIAEARHEVRQAS